MGMTLQIDANIQEPLASTTGWSDVLDWVISLPDDEYIALRHLCQYGWREGVSELIEELRGALEEHPPKRADVQETLDNLLAVLEENEDATVVSVSDGLSK